MPAASASTNRKGALPTLRATSGALRALKYFGGQPRDAKACTEFVKSCFDEGSGGFADRLGGKPDVISTAVGLMAVVELKLSRELYAAKAADFLDEKASTFEEIRMAAAGLEAIGKRPPQAAAWLDKISTMRNPEGDFGKGPGRARDTGGAVVAMLRLGGELDGPDQIVKTLKAGQRPDGGFGKPEAKGSDLESTYRIMRAFVMLKEKLPDADGCRRFVASCRNADGGYGLVPGQPSTVGATYFASVILHWLAKPQVTQPAGAQN